MAGDSTAEFREYSDALYAFAKKRVASDDDILDLIQDTFADFLRQKSEFRGEASTLTYMTAILKNKIYDLYRKQNREIAVDDQNLEIMRENSAAPQRAATTPEAALSTKDLREKIEAAVKRLQSPYFEAFVMREIDELATPEICKKLGVTATNLNVMLYRARGRLMQILKEEGIDGAW